MIASTKKNEEKRLEFVESTCELLTGDKTKATAYKNDSFVRLMFPRVKGRGEVKVWGVWPEGVVRHRETVDWVVHSGLSRHTLSQPVQALVVTSSSSTSSSSSSSSSTTSTTSTSPRSGGSARWWSCPVALSLPVVPLGLSPALRQSGLVLGQLGHGMARETRETRETHCCHIGTQYTSAPLRKFPLSALSYLLIDQKIWALLNYSY